MSNSNYLARTVLSVKFVLATLFLIFSSGSIAEATDRMEAKQLYESSCSRCHGLYVTERRRDGKFGWEEVVDKMIIYGAQLTTGEMATVVNYLTENYGPGTTTPMKTGLLPHNSPLQSDGTVTSENIDLPKGSGRELVQGLCTSCHDLGRVVATRRDKDNWQHYTKIMLAKSGIEIQPKELTTVVSYLNKHFGKNDERLKE